MTTIKILEKCLISLVKTILSSKKQKPTFDILESSHSINFLKNIFHRPHAKHIFLIIFNFTFMVFNQEKKRKKERKKAVPSNAM